MRSFRAYKRREIFLFFRRVHTFTFIMYVVSNISRKTTIAVECLILLLCGFRLLHAVEAMIPEDGP